MENEFGIRYLKRDEIDTDAWDTTIDQSPNGLPYAYSWYLDEMAGDWHALVKGAYTAVMPLPTNRKLLGYPQVFQPFFTQQLGIFNRFPLSYSMTEAFLEAIPTHFRKIHYCFHAQVPPLPIDRGVWEKRLNLVLDLNAPYEDIQQNYGKSLRKRIRKARDEHKLVFNTVSPAELTQLYRSQLSDKVDCPASAYESFTRVMETAIEKGKGRIAAAQGPDGTLRVAGFFLESHGRTINLFGASTEEGKEHHSMHFLLDALIRERANTRWVFDFEGSSIPSVAYFFQSFGAEESPYFCLKEETLPTLLSSLDQLRKK
jgi:hypothetical protein